jgi:cell division septal protein FtsQ
MDRTIRTRTEKREPSGNLRDSRRAAAPVSSRRKPPVMSRSELGMNSTAVPDQRILPRKRVDLSLSSPGAEIRLPAIPRVSNKWRILSGVLSIGLLTGLILLTQVGIFQVSDIQIQGLERFSEGEIKRAINLSGSSIFFINPELIKKDLQVTYPGLSDIDVKISWPANVLISLKERFPVLAWNWDGHVRWVDKNGVAFQPHDEGLDVVQVKTNLVPPTIEDRFVDPRIVDAVAALSPHIPENVDMIFDPDHGLGWHDPRGWVAYFGFNNDDADQKINVYQSLVEYLEGKRISPKIINVEFLDSPYFRME